MKKYMAMIAMLAAVSACVPKYRADPVSFSAGGRDGLMMFYKGHELIGTEYYRDEEEMRGHAEEWKKLGPLLPEEGVREVIERGTR